MSRYLESYGGEYDDEDYSSGTVYYDRNEKRWKCRCPDWRAKRRCRHVRWFRRQDTVKVSKRYL